MDGRIRKLEADLQATKRLLACTVLLFGVISLVAFRQAGRAHFTELDVERLNVVEADGTLRLAIANRERFAHPTFYGKEYPGIRGGSAPGAAGMIYFNDEGTEMGGFAWSGKESEDGAVRAVGMLTFDHYNQNEAVSLGFSDMEGRRQAGLTILDQPYVSIQPVADTLLLILQLPEGPEETRRMQALREGMVRRGEVGFTRLRVGRWGDGGAGVELMDPQGRPRLRMSVDSAGSPRLEFLDGEGKLILQLPGEGR